MAVYTLHLWPLVGDKDAPRTAQADHYTGTAKDKRVPARLVDHALGRGAKILAHQVSQGGKWVVAKIEPGGYERERQLKKQGGASRRCGVCKAVKDFEAGKVTEAEALARAGWETANPAEKTTLLQIFGLDAESEDIPHVEPAPFVPREAPEVIEKPTPELDATVDALIEGWAKEPHATPEGESAPEKEMEVEFG